MKQCCIEIIKDHCPACFISKFNLNLISRKMRKHGVLDQLPLYRMKITNSVPWLGDLPHTPIHLYLRKHDDGSLAEIKLIDSPLPQKKTDNFLKQLEEKSGLKNLSQVIKIDVMAQRTKFFNMLDMEENFDFDFDSGKHYVTVTER